MCVCVCVFFKFQVSIGSVEIHFFIHFFDGKNGKKGGKGQTQSQNRNPHKEVVCLARWEERTLEHRMSVEPREPVSLRRRPTQGRHGQKSGLFGTSRPSCSCGTTAATVSCDLSGLSIV